MWFTPPKLAKRIVNWALDPLASYQTVIEPSAGLGALASEIRAYHRKVAIGSPVCIDVDPMNVRALMGRGLDARCADFLEFWPELRFDIAVMNPPFENGQTEAHIMHALKHCDRVVCHCPLTTLAGKARRENMWSHVQLHRLAICSTRSKYGEGVGQTDMCTIDVTLREGWVGKTDVEWWP